MYHSALDVCLEGLPPRCGHASQSVSATAWLGHGMYACAAGWQALQRHVLHYGMGHAAPQQIEPSLIMRGGLVPRCKQLAAGLDYPKVSSPVV